MKYFVDVKIEGMDKALKQMNSMKEMRPFLWKVSKELTKSLRIYTPKWRGNLRASTKVLPIGNKYIRIYQLFYGRFVQMEHLIHDVPLVKQWYMTKLGFSEERYEAYARRALPKLSRANPYMIKAINDLNGKLEKIHKEFIQAQIGKY